MRRLSTLLASLLAMSLLPACNSFQSRAKEKSEVFAALDDATRARLEAGEIRVGDSPDMVYLALGRPSEKKEKLTAEGRAGTWIYSAYWQEFQGTQLVGYRRDVVFNRATKSYQVIYTPDYQPVYTPRVEDRIRVTFEKGVVAAIETAQPKSRPPGTTVK